MNSYLKSLIGAKTRAKTGKKSAAPNPFSSFVEEEDYDDDYGQDEFEDEDEDEEAPVRARKAQTKRTVAPQAKRVTAPPDLSKRSASPSGLPNPTPTPTPRRTAASATISRQKPKAPVAAAPVTPPPKAKPVAPSKTVVAAPKPVATSPKPRREKKVNATVANPVKTSSSDSAASSFGYTGSLTKGSLLTPPTQPPNKVIPSLRAAGQRRMDRGDARTLDQGTALEIVSKIVGRNVSITDIDNEKKSAVASYAIFAAPTELVTLFELAMRMVESHQFYSRTV
jgi:hypothetical protein